MTTVRALAVAALCVGCNIVYVEDSPYVAPLDAGFRFDRPLSFDVRPMDTRGEDVLAVGRPCEDAECPSPLVCARRSCGNERSCVVRVTLCEAEFVPVCDCDGTTLLNECAARATGGGVAYAGVCDGRSLDDAGIDATADVTATIADAGPNRCVGTICDDGYVCCAEPTSPAYGRCQPLSCATCCRRAE